MRELDEYPGGEFGPGTAPHIWLVGYIYQQVGEFAGYAAPTETRKADLSSVCISVVLAGVLGWVSYYLVGHGFGWWAAFPVTAGSFMAYAATVMYFEKEPVVAEGNLSEFEDREAEDQAALADIEDLEDEEPPEGNIA